MGKKVTLHEEIRDILEREGNQWMTTSELAFRVNCRGRYRKRDGSSVSPFQIHGLTRNYSRLFERNGSLVRVILEQSIVASLGAFSRPLRMRLWILSPGSKRSSTRKRNHIRLIFRRHDKDLRIR